MAYFDNFIPHIIFTLFFLLYLSSLSFIWHNHLTIFIFFFFFFLKINKYIHLQLDFLLHNLKWFLKSKIPALLGLHCSFVNGSSWIVSVEIIPLYNDTFQIICPCTMVLRMHVCVSKTRGLIWGTDFHLSDSF
jgi:hypothetical protein